MMKSRVLLFLAAIVLLGTSWMFGQAISGDLVGTIVDKSGALVPSATVEVVNRATNVTSRTVANGSGEYRFSNLPVGVYDITASAPGFGTRTLKGFTIELNKTVTARVQLDVGATATTVEVTDTAPAIDTTTAQVQTTYESRLAQDLPNASLGGSAGGGVLNLSLLQSGVGSSGGLGAGSGPSVGGQRPRNNNFTIEGVDNNNKGITGPLAYVPNDAVQNFTVLQNQFSPEFGHSTGGQFNTVVQSGTNAFHGRAYEYFQNRNLNAIDEQLAITQGLTKNPRYDNNRFGGQIGAPVIKNRLFFFANYEYNPIGQASTGGSLIAPTAAGYATLAATPGLNQSSINGLKQYAVAPAACSASDISSGNCPKGSVLPLAGGAPVQVGVLPFSAPNFSNFKVLTTSMDWNISDRDQFRGRYIYNGLGYIDNGITSGSGVEILPQFFTTVSQPDHLVTLSEYHTFTPMINNEFRVGYSRFAQTFTVPSLKFSSLDAFPNLTIDDLNGINVGPDPNAPQFTIQNMYQLTDNVNWTKGTHTIKFGFEGRKAISPQVFIQRARGDYEWNSLSDFAHDVTPAFAERSFGSVGYSGDQHALYGFVNDIWKVRPNVTLNLGLRYEFTSTPFGWTQQALNNFVSVPGLISFGSPKAPKKDFMPRLGFAWSPGSSATTSIRGGFGIGYDVLYDNIGVLSRPPQIGSTSDCPGGAGCSPNGQFLAKGGIVPSGQTGITTLTAAQARAATSALLPVDVKYPYSEQWNLGVQHSFGSNYTAEVRYLGSRGVHLNVQNRINKIATVDSTHFLPTFFSQPSAATIAGLTTTLAQLQAIPNTRADFLAAGFTNPIVAFEPFGGSTYHSLATQLNRRFSNGLQMQAAWTWSHLIDDSTADFFSTVLTPRRPQDFQNMHVERGNSALDRAHRITLSAVYDAPWLKHSNWFLKNVAGNWEVAPIYTFETGEWADPQSGTDTNLNGDSAGDRVIINAAGDRRKGTDVTALKNASGATVGYVVNDPTAYFVRARAGALATSSRNILQLPPINNWDINVLKRFSATERYKFEIAAQFLNAFNHPQFVAGSLNQITSISTTSGTQKNYLIPGASNFDIPKVTFSSNPRAMQLSAKFIF
jgi:hypothetical protein